MTNISNLRLAKNASVQLLQELNDNEANVLLPVVIYVFILMVFGIVGNLIVLYIYKCRFRKSSSRAFILCLGMLDLITCLFGMPFHVIDMRFPYMFVWDIPCKVLCFLMTSTILSSTFILVLISIERYRKICLPFEKQISDIGTKAICTGCIFAAFLLSSPVLLLYGSASIEIKTANVTGVECYISDHYRDTIFPLIYDTTTLVLFVISTFALGILYTRIGITVWRQGTFQSNRNCSKNCVGLGTPTPDQSRCQNFDGTIEMSNLNVSDHQHRATTLTTNTFDEYSNVLLNSPKLRQNVRQLDRDRRMEIRRSSLRLKRRDSSKRSSFRASLRSSLRIKSRSSSDDSSSESLSSTPERRSNFVRDKLHLNTKLSRRKRRSLRITGMLTLITIVFTISFLPYLVISILNGINDEFWTNMTSTEVLIYNFLLRTYLINNMANPLIYSFLDEKFRSELRKLLKCC